MIEPAEALQTLDRAAYYLEIYTLGRARGLPVFDVIARITHMRDELWVMLVTHDPAISDQLWAEMRWSHPYCHDDIVFRRKGLSVTMQDSNGSREV